ncbi:MAG TPA: hypothetical protein VHZ02_11760 [Acidimicrobiales bacterium]|nr:hypothetical protein [Acidimicrobiales bacterium]
MVNCKNCGDALPEERRSSGYDYCTAPACVEACLRGPNVLAIHVNKSNDQYVLRKDVDIPQVVGGTRVDGGHYGAPPRPHRPSRPRSLTDGQQIDRMRRELDATLEKCVDKAERSRLIDTYNARVRRMNIRYRRMGLYPREAQAKQGT